MRKFIRPAWPSIRAIGTLTCLIAGCSTLSYGADLSASIVTIYASTKSRSSQGTGFVIGNKGLIVTAYHVIQGASDIKIHDSEFRSMSDVTIQHIDAQRDLAVLRSRESEQLPGLRLASTPPAAQSSVTVAGSPRGLPKQILFGHITSNSTVSSLAISGAGGRRVFAQDVPVFPIDITVYSGMSGAPVIVNNAAIGVLSGSYDEGRGIAWAIPINFVSDLVNSGIIGKAANAVPVWPTLSLMRDSWISLARSYGKVFSSEHMARLEILEGALRDLRGTWVTEGATATASQFIPGREPYSFGTCHVSSDYSVELTIDALDTDSAKLTGTVQMRKSIRTELTDPSPNAPSVVANLTRLCSAQSGSARTQGKMTLYVDDVQDYTEKGNSLQAESYTSDCTGALCTATIYGKADEADVERISDSKIRMGDLIFERRR